MVSSSPQHISGQTPGLEEAFQDPIPAPAAPPPPTNNAKGKATTPVFPLRGSLDTKNGSPRDRPLLFPTLGICPPWESTLSSAGAYTSSWSSPILVLLALSPSRCRWSLPAQWEPGAQLTKGPGRENPNIPVTLARITASAWEKGSRKSSFSECPLYTHYFI